MNDEELSVLRIELVKFTENKFRSRPNICELAEDITEDVFLDFFIKNNVNSEKLNFGYMAAACVRQAYKYFRKWDIQSAKFVSFPDCLDFLSEEDVVQEILQNEETKEILDSLQTLKEIERNIVFGRYYGDLKFNEIAVSLGINLNTALSHHRRALEKLRPVLSRYFND